MENFVKRILAGGVVLAFCLPAAAASAKNSGHGAGATQSGDIRATAVSATRSSGEIDGGVDRAEKSRFAAPQRLHLLRAAGL